MRTYTAVILLVLAIGTPIGHESVNAQDQATVPSKADIEQIVHEYLLGHPEVIMEAVRTFQERRQAEDRERARQALTAKQAELFHDPMSPAVGSAPDAVRVVEFFDYRCPYCQRVDSTVLTLIAEHPNIRVIFKEFPILGPESTLAAKAALAADHQGAYLGFHEALMASNEPISEALLQQLATKLGLDPARLKADMDSPAVHDAIERNRSLAQALSIDSTPTFVIESEVVEGILDAEAFQELLAKAQAQKK